MYTSSYFCKLIKMIYEDKFYANEISKRFV